MINFRKNLGDFGENQVAKYLKKNKFKVTNRNFTCHFGEIDVIAENKGLILFVEVKTRHIGQSIAPIEAVGYYKQQKIIKTAKYYLQKYKVNKQPRFDVAEVIIDDKGTAKINYISNAFWS